MRKAMNICIASSVLLIFFYFTFSGIDLRVHEFMEAILEQIFSNKLKLLLAVHMNQEIQAQDI